MVLDEIGLGLKPWLSRKRCGGKNDGMEPIVSLPGCKIHSVVKQAGSLVITACSGCCEALCPDCGVLSKRVHGHYVRSPRDLPLFEHGTRLVLQVKRFCCLNPCCPRRTFAEASPELVERYAHRTERLKIVHQVVSVALSAEAGSQLPSKLRMSLSADTLLRAVRSRAITEGVSPKVIGVDDWAIRKNFSYETIIVDLEARRVVELLKGRDARTLEEWLLEQETSR